MKLFVSELKFRSELFS